MYMSSHCIRKIGDLNTICVALLLYACSFLALSFTRIAWLVIVIDTCQATAYGLNYCAFIMLFSKAASKENLTVIFGEYKPWQIFIKFTGQAWKLLDHSGNPRPLVCQSDALSTELCKHTRSDFSSVGRTHWIIADKCSRVQFPLRSSKIFSFLVRTLSSQI